MRVFKWLAITVGILALLLGATVAGAVWFAGSEQGRAFAAGRLSALLGREVGIDGPLRLRLGDPLRVHVEGLRIANPPWAQDAELARVGVLDVTVRPWPILRGDWEFPEIRVSGAALSLEKNREGGRSWSFGTPGAAVAEEAATPEDRGDAPLIERLVIDDSRLRFRDPAMELDLESTIATALGDNNQDRLGLEGKGTLAGEAFTVSAQGASLLSLHDGGEPYPLKIAATVGKTRSTVEGTLGEPIRFEGVDLAMHLQGDDLSRLVGVFGIVFPKTRDYDLAGHLARDGAVWRLEGIKGRVGESDLSGDAAVDTGGGDSGGKRPRITGTLTSNRLAAVDLAGFVGASPRGREDYATKTATRVLPATPVNLERLRTADMDIHFTGKRVEAPGALLDDLQMHLVLENGRAVFEPLALGMAGGRIDGTVTLDGRGDTPSLAASLTLRRLDLARFFRGTDFARQMGGTINGRVQFSGRGSTVADMLAVADGKAGLAVDGGRISVLAVKGLKTNILETLGIVLSGDRPVPFNCLVADLTIDKGMVRSKALVLDTPETLVTGEGTINLRNETLDMRVRGQAKQAQVFATHVPVTVRGTLLNPELGFDAVESAARGAAALALGVLLTPLAAIIPLLDTGTDEQPHCRSLVRDAKTPPAGAAPTGTGRTGGPGRGSGSGR